MLPSTRIFCRCFFPSLIKKLQNFLSLRRIMMSLATHEHLSQSHAAEGGGSALYPAHCRSSFLNRIEPLWTIGGNLRKATKKHPKWCGSALKSPNKPADTSLQVTVLSPCVSKLNLILILRWKYSEKHRCLSCCHSFWHLVTNKQRWSCAVTVTKYIPMYAITKKRQQY